VPGTPPPIGPIVSIQFDVGMVREVGEVSIPDLVKNPAVIASVRAVQSAETPEARVNAIAQLMENLE
jgi:hypothetical protein